MAFRFLVLVVLVVNAGLAKADFLTFNLVIPSSSLSLSGSSDVTGAGTFSYQAQAAGSLATTYAGTFGVNVDNILNPTSIAFVSGSLTANNNGSWLPNNGGTSGTTAAIGNYGIAVTAIQANAKLREVVFNLSAASTSVASGTGAFSVTGQTFQHTAGAIDVFSALLGGGGTSALVNSGLNVNAANGTYTVSGGIATLTIPVTFSVGYAIPAAGVTGTNTFTGTLVGITAVPEPCSMILIGGAFGCVAFLRKRRIQS